MARPRNKIKNSTTKVDQLQIDIRVITNGYLVVWTSFDKDSLEYRNYYADTLGVAIAFASEKFEALVKY
jgi:hypothetical protein